MRKKLFALLTVSLISIYLSLATLGCPAPNLVSFEPAQGTNTQIIEVTITGSQFHKSVFVKLTKAGQPDIMATDLKILSPTQISCKLDLRGKLSGKWSLVVANIGTFTKKEKPAVSVDGFLIENPIPSITSVTPNQAIYNKTIETSISGSNFRPGAIIMLSNGTMDIGATNVNILSDTRISCQFNLNGAALGVYNLKVINDDGQTGMLPNSFTVVKPAPAPVPDPIINSLSPDRGFNNGSILVNFDGANFAAGLKVKLSRPGQTDIPGLNVQPGSASHFSCFFDIAEQPVGKYDVIVTNPDGHSATLAGGFTVEVFTPALDPNKLLKPVYFDYNKWNLKSDQSPILVKDLAILKDNPNLYILLGGHADERGSREYNLELSSKRANTIKQYLVAQGIAPERITIYAYGKDYLAKTEHTETAQKYNRRVDILMWEAPPTKEQGIVNPNI